MRLIILGAGGMLGQELARVFGDFEVTALDRHEIDITKNGKVEKEIGRVKPDVIINAAAYTDVDGAESNRETAFEVNELGVRNLAVAAKKTGAKLVHFSTDYVFPGDKKEGYKEDDLPGPAENTYGESKLAGEKVLRKSGVEYYLVRTAWLYGAGGKNFVDTILRLATEKNELRVVNDQFGSPTWAADLARAIKELVEEKYEPGVYHLVNDGVASWYEFAREIMKLRNKNTMVVPVTTQEFPRPATRPKYSILINTKGPKLRDWREALQEYLLNPKIVTK